MDNSDLTDQNAWAFTEVVLDTIFDFLKPPDLQRARLTCRKWAVEGSRHLARKTLIRLSQVTTVAAHSDELLLLPHLMDHFKHRNWLNQLEFRQSEENAPYLDDDGGYLVEYESDIWESTGDLEPREYFKISDYCSYIKSAVFSSEFKPRSVIVYTYADLTFLPMPHFSYLEKLQIVFVKSTEVYILLKHVGNFLPYLKSLKLGQIAPKSSLRSPPTKLTSDSNIVQVEQHSSLEELSFSVPADLIHLDWSFLVKFSNLKKLQIHWSGALRSVGKSDFEHSMRRSPVRKIHRSYNDSRNFANWLQATNPLFNWTSLKTLSLRFDLMSTNSQGFQSTLAVAVNLESLSLQVYGPFRRLQKLIKGLGPKNVALLKDLQYSKEDMLLDLHAAAGIRILKMLDDQGFFLKPTWTVAFCGADHGCCCMEKTPTHFACQTSRRTRHNLADFVQTLWQQFPAIFANYNYAFMINTDEHGVTRKLSEAVGSDAFLDDDFLSFKLLPVPDRTARRIRQKPFDRLLCDSSGFYKEAGLRLGQYSKEMAMRTVVFAQVQQLLLTKWINPMPIQPFNLLASLQAFLRLSWQPAAELEKFADDNENKEFLNYVDVDLYKKLWAK